MLLAQALDQPWRWQPHPEVWLLLVSVVGIGLYVTRVIAPKVVAAGGEAVTRRQKAFFVAGLVVLWLATDWPMHDIAEEYLYSVHMVQHTLLTMVMPPLFLFATPTWLARLLLGDGPVGRFLSQLCRPVVAGLAFNLVSALIHWTTVVNTSVEVGPFHYAVHSVIVLLAFTMWMPVCGPLPERRLSLPGQMIYLFLMSIIPTVPAAWLTLAENPLYEVYDKPFRMWGVSVAADQQLAGLIMKIGVGMYLWTLIAILFFRWAALHAAADRAGIIRVNERDLLTWDDVQHELERLPPPREEPQARA
ncbi:MAG: hypothetical protein GEV08_04145 [Acidimicrobiia bacterium]|nr:hypothetical protein [Acidimicrobiia bacterium]